MFSWNQTGAPRPGASEEPYIAEFGSEWLKTRQFLTFWSQVVRDKRELKNLRVLHNAFRSLLY